MSKTYQEFNPPAVVQRIPEEKIGPLREALGHAPLDRLCEQNAKWFKEPMSDPNVARSWLINCELTDRGVGPRWRGITGYTPDAVPSVRLQDWPASRGPAPLGDAMKRKLLSRWVDLYWLRSQLGHSHMPSDSSCRPLFDDEAPESFRQAVVDRLAKSKEQSRKLINRLGVAEDDALALRGFVTARASDRVRAAQKRVQRSIWPKIEAHAKRTRYSLSEEQIRNRLVYAEAIELSRGSPTKGARLVRWISGQQVTPQAVHKMRVRIAADLCLRGRAWR